LVFSGLWLALSPPASAALATLTGKVTDLSGAGIFNVTINFVDACTGVTSPATGNVTSSTGDFRATVNAGVYDLEFSPPAGSLYHAWRIRNFDLTLSRTLAPVRLGFGVIVSGRVNDSAGAGIPNVFVRFFPPGSSDRTFAVRDRADLSGNFSIVVPAGTYDVKYGPPTGTRYLGLVRPSVSIPGNTTLPTVALASGLLVSGILTDSAPQAHPAVNANVDATNTATGEKLFLSHDRTDATGAFTLAIPPGTYVFGFKPEKCNLLVGQESAPTTIAADTTLPAVALLPGVLVNGTVTDTRGAPVPDVNTNFISTTTGLQVFTFDDHTNAAGACSVVIPGQDSYNVDFAPGRGVRLAGFKLYGASINNNASQVLPTVQLRDAFLVTGRALSYLGAPLAGVDLDFFLAGKTTKIYTPNDRSDAAGTFTVAVEPDQYDIRFEPMSTTVLAAKRLRGIRVSADLSLGDVTIPPGLTVSGNASYMDPALVALPVDNLDMDFYHAYTGEKAETLHDNTDCAGNYSVTVPPGIYNVVFVPPSCNAGSSCPIPAPCTLETVRLPTVVITAPLSGLNAVLRTASFVSGNLQSVSNQPVASVDLDFFVAGTDVRKTVSRDNSDLQGLFGVFVLPGVYDILFTPPATAGLAPLRVASVNAGADIDLGTLVLDLALAPGVTSITPSSSPTSGGVAVTIQGGNFQIGAGATLGGLMLRNIQVAGPTEIRAVAPACPAGPAGAVVDLVVANVGAPPATLPQSFTYVPATTAGIDLALGRSFPDVVLSWPATGQAFYTVFRSASPSLFGQAQVLATAAASGAATQSFIDYGAEVDGATYFYRVE
jgi:hypothetical protein